MTIATPFPRNYGLDVARSMAILMVLLIHSIKSMFHYTPPYGWYIGFGGVELFFSLSGFLIGRFILELFDNNNFSYKGLRRFWIRRWLRTLPLYLFLFPLYWALVNIFLTPVDFDPSYLVFMQSLSTHRTFFPETWSIAIEEWFYLLFPCIAVLLRALSFAGIKFFNGRNAVVGSALICIIVMIIARVWTADPLWYHHGVLFRLDASAYGVLAAYLSSFYKTRSNKFALTLIVTGLAIWGLAVLLHLINYSNLVSSLYYPLCGIGTAIFVSGTYYYQFHKQFASISFISRISYSIYLVNFTGIFYPMEQVTIHLNRAQQAGCWVLGIALVIAVSTLTYRFIEEPFLKLKNQVR
ncbi:MAG: acyltransferase [Pedobacter sp.]|nr:MAG: acyltransferase [Pedobacter sp.]